MLVLSRKPAETIIINDSIRVTVLGIKGNQVRLGIEAPPEVTIDREEIHRRREQWVGTDAQQALHEACSG